MGLFRNPAALVILLLLVILLFGAGKLPGLAKNLGQSMRIFKSEVEEMTHKDGKDGDEDGDARDRRRDDRYDEDRRRDDRYEADRRRDDRYEADRRRDEREYDPRDARDERDAVRAHEDDDRYRRG